MKKEKSNFEDIKTKWFFCLNKTWKIEIRKQILLAIAFKVDWLHGKQWKLSRSELQIIVKVEK